MFDRGHNSAELPSPPEPLPPHAPVAIIGGGVMGVSTAFPLARAGAGSVLVIEQNLLGWLLGEAVGWGEGNVRGSRQHCVGATQSRSL